MGKTLILYPNPSRGEANVAYHLDGPGMVELRIMSLAGETCQRLVLGQESAGTRSLALNLSRLASGVYLAHLRNDQGQGQVQNAWFKFAVIK